MNKQYTYLQGYNAQALVAEDQIIVAAAITQEPADTHQLHPMLHEAGVNLEAAKISDTIGVGLADAGYYSEANLAIARQEDPEFLIATTRQSKHRAGAVSGRGVPTGARGRVMQDKLATDEGRSLYAKRAHTVEPVFGHIKDIRGARRFTRRGLRACEAEWKLICATHNLLKLWRHSGI